MPPPSGPNAYARAHRRRFVEELKEFVRFPSVSAQPAHAGDVRRCAEWLAAHLARVGLDNARVIRTPRHPIVYADWRHAPGRPTVLVYGHYDVQPPEPLAEWRTPPFEPTLRGEDLYGRGTSDDKGQLFTHVKALECLLRAGPGLPVNVRCLFEGEEEIGSPNLKAFIERNHRALSAGVVVLSDTRMLGPNRPAITYALRGGLSMELEVTGPPQDLHSGNFGGAIHNPAQVLCEVIAALHDARGRVRIPGFYDRVCRPDAAERDYMAHAGPTDRAILRAARAPAGWGEHGWTPYEQTTVRPALTVSGLGGGYQGVGGKSIIPARAFAKINIRLVPEQDPREVEALLRRHVSRLTPPTVRASLKTYFRNSPAVIDRSHPAMRAAFAALREGFGAEPVFVRSGGSIPVVSTFQESLGAPIVLMGFALPDDRIHAPNEKFHLPNFYKGITTSINFLNEVASRLSLSRGARTGPRVNHLRAEFAE